MYKLLPILLFAYGLALTTEDIYDNSYALIIGIDKYQNVQPLNYAVKDAESIQDILVNTFDFPESNIKLLKNEEATKQNILKSFSDITKKADDKDRVLIYFAGHGATDDLPEGGEMGYLLPVDGDNDDLFLSSIAMDDLKRISLMSKAKHLLYLVDACYGGIAAIGSRGLDSKSTPNYIEKITKNKSRQIITAGGRGEEVIETSEWGHSAFTLNLNRGLKDGNADLNGDGYITANELGMFLSEKVTIDSENQQTPQYGRMTSQEGEFVFVYSENTVVLQDESTNSKLDVVLSKLEKLESEKVNNDDKLEEKKSIFSKVKKIIDEMKKRESKQKNIWEGWSYEGSRAIGFAMYDYGYGINYYEYLSLGIGLTMGFHHNNDNDMQMLFSLPESISVEQNSFSIGLHASYPFSHKIEISGGIFLSNVVDQWENVTLNTSGKFKAIVPGGGFGLNFFPFSFERPLRMVVCISLGSGGIYYPRKYEIDLEGTVTQHDSKLIVHPNIGVSLIVPKY